MATRIAYAFILLINSIVSWIMLTPWALKKLQHLTLDYMEIRCDGKECHGWVAVHRINFGLGLFHLILALLLLGVKNSRDSRAALQNGFWGPKIILWLAFVVMSFFIPESFFFVYGNYIAFFCAMLFLLLGLILLVDLAHSWAELCLQKIEDSDSRMWRGLLVGSTLGMYLASVVMTILMYIFFAGSSCTMNQAAISVSSSQYPANHGETNDLGQLDSFLDYFLRFRATCCTGQQPTSRFGSGCHGHSLLYLSHPLCRIDGTR
jgi:hypothetical protein